jgi:hypothetical protein
MVEPLTLIEGGQNSGPEWDWTDFNEPGGPRDDRDALARGRACRFADFVLVSRRGYIIIYEEDYRRCL